MGMIYDKQKIKESLPFEQVLQHYGIEERRGKLPCPFHNETVGSATINRGEYFYCFGCQASYDVIGFIAAMENISFKDAVKYAAQMAGISPQSRERVGDNIAKRKKALAIKTVLHAVSEIKYRILSTVARSFRPFVQNTYTEKLDILLDAWLYDVPLWVDIRPLAFAAKGGNAEKCYEAIERLYQERGIQ